MLRQSKKFQTPRNSEKPEVTVRQVVSTINSLILFMGNIYTSRMHILNAKKINVKYLFKDSNDIFSALLSIYLWYIYEYFFLI